MPSQARRSFDRNVSDVERLLEIHAQLGGSGAGRRHRLEVLNKSAIVFVSAYWEAYCEDIAAEALEHVVEFATSADRLPKELQRQLAKEIKNAPHELEMWKLAGNGWRLYLRTRLALLQEKRNRNLNTPKTAQIEQLFSDAIGIPKISAKWTWPGMNPNRASKKLDRFVELRGAIAHRGRHHETVRRTDVEEYLRHVEELAAKTGRAVNSHVRKITGKSLWR